MRRLLLFATTTLLTASAQSLVDADHLAGARAAFESTSSAGALKCQFSPVLPALNFSLRFQTGFSVELPLHQFHGPGHGWEILLRVTPEGDKPVFLTLAAPLPEVPSTKALEEFDGTYVVGEGVYRVDALLKDDAHRVCKATWRIAAKPEASERSLRPSLAAGAVAELAAKPALSSGAREAKLGRLTVLLHAASLAPGRAKLQPSDVLALCGSLGSLLEQLPVRSVRVVVFSLDQRAVLYQKDDFDVGDLDRAAETLSQIQLAVVSYKTLQTSTGPLEMAANLLRNEFAKPNPPDAVVFLGPYSPMRSNASTPLTPPTPIEAVKLFYLQYRRAPFMRRMPPTREAPQGRGGNGRGRGPNMGFPGFGPPQWPDAIAILTKATKGETITVHTPHEFAGAINRILDRLGGS